MHLSKLKLALLLQTKSLPLINGSAMVTTKNFHMNDSVKLKETFTQHSLFVTVVNLLRRTVHLQLHTSEKKHEKSFLATIMHLGYWTKFC